MRIARYNLDGTHIDTFYSEPPRRQSIRIIDVLDASPDTPCIAFSAYLEPFLDKFQTGKHRLYLYNYEKREFTELGPRGQFGFFLEDDILHKWLSYQKEITESQN